MFSVMSEIFLLIFYENLLNLFEFGVLLRVGQYSEKQNVLLQIKS